MPFVKLDSGLLNSTLWFDKAARDVFITALLMAVPHEITEAEPQIHIDRIEETGWSVPPGWYGLVESAAIGILAKALVERDQGLRALTTLGEPDPESRSVDFDGRRLVRIDGGYLVLNFQKYRERDYGAIDRMRRLRARRKGASADSGSQNPPKSADRPPADTDMPTIPVLKPGDAKSAKVLEAALNGLGVTVLRRHHRNVTPNCDGSRSIEILSDVSNETSSPPSRGDLPVDNSKSARKPKAAETKHERFTEFWEAWPKNERKHDKAKCCEHWARHELDKIGDAILADVQAKRGSRKWTEGGGEFIEAPLTYLRGKRWEDGTELAVKGKPWYDTGPGIEAKGVELGVGPWDRKTWEGSGGLRGEPWVTYAKRVFAKAGHSATS